MGSFTGESVDETDSLVFFNAKIQPISSLLIINRVSRGEDYFSRKRDVEPETSSLRFSVGLSSPSSSQPERSTHEMSELVK